MNERQPEKELSILVRQLPLETETCFFILANTLDVVMTYMLLNLGPHFQESNLIAHYFLTKYGFTGMIYFKFALVAFVAVITQLIARSHLTTARWLLNAGTTIVGMVVLYSLALWIKYSGF